MVTHDPVTPEVREAVLRRDGRCFLARTDPGHLCRDVWGYAHRSDDLSRLTLEHVKDEPRMGVRAPSDVAHLVALCGAVNIGVPSKVLRGAMREYLRSVTG